MYQLMNKLYTESMESSVKVQYKPVSPQDISKAESTLGFKFGPQYKMFLFLHGTLMIPGTEIYGISSSGTTHRNTTVTTLQQRDYHRGNSGPNRFLNVAVVEADGGGNFYVVDAKDDVYFVDHEDELLRSQNMKFAEFLHKRISES